MLHSNASEVKIAASTHFWFKLGNVPGIAASNKDTQLFTGDENSNLAPEKSLDSDAIWMWTSKPTTLFQSDLKHSHSFHCINEVKQHWVQLWYKMGN